MEMVMAMVMAMVMVMIMMIPTHEWPDPSKHLSHLIDQFLMFIQRLRFETHFCFEKPTNDSWCGTRFTFGLKSSTNERLYSGCVRESLNRASHSYRVGI